MAESETVEEMAYIARHDCGKVVWAAVDKPSRKDTIADELPGLIRDGLAIERLTVESVRAELAKGMCRHFLNAEQEQSELEGGG